MKVLLKQDIPNLGKKHEIKNVKRGYFVNYLLPRDLCVVATSGRIKQSKVILDLKKKKLSKIQEKANEMLVKLKDLVLTFQKKTSAKNRLFGSIDEKDILEKLKKEKNIILKHENLKLKNHIKTLGEHKITVHLVEGVEAEIKVVVEEEK